MWALSAARSESNVSLVFLPSQMRFSCVSLTLQPPTPLGEKKPSEWTSPVLYQSPSVPYVLPPLLLLWSFPCFSKDTLVCSISQCSHFLRVPYPSLSFLHYQYFTLYCIFYQPTNMLFPPS